MLSPTDLALGSPELRSALKKAPSEWDYKDRLIIDATVDYVGRMAILELREKLLAN